MLIVNDHEYEEFDGNEQEPSIKDNTHLRRRQSIYPVLSFSAKTEFSRKKESSCQL